MHRVFLDLTDYPDSVSESPYSVMVDWGDGSVSDYPDITVSPEFVHDYATAGTYYVVFTLVNVCGRQQRRLEITLHAGYADDLRNKHLRTFQLTMEQVGNENVPPLTVTGEVQEFLLASSVYGYETTITTDVELVRFPKNYERISASEVLLGEDIESNLGDNNTLNLHMAVSNHSEPAVLYGGRSFSLVFDFKDMHDPANVIQLYYNVLTVEITADAAFFTRCSCADLLFSALVDNGDGTVTQSLDFEGNHIAGFQLEIADGEEARVYRIVINVAQEAFSVIPVNHLDLYAVSFITNKRALLDATRMNLAVVSGGAAGQIPIISTRPIAYVEVVCDDAVKNRILYDDVKITDGQYVLQVKNTGADPFTLRIPISTGETGKIFYIQAFQLVPPSVENLPIVFRADINQKRQHVTYFYNETGLTLTSQDSFIDRLTAIVGTCTLQTIYGEVICRFYAP